MLVCMCVMCVCVVCVSVHVWYECVGMCICVSGGFATQMLSQSEMESNPNSCSWYRGCAPPPGVHTLMSSHTLDVGSPLTFSEQNAAKVLCCHFHS